MSARKAWGVCPAGTRTKVRYRNRKAALAGLQAVRHSARQAGTPEEVWPTDAYRCPPRGDGGCGGWHLRADRRTVEDYVFGTLRRGHQLAPAAGRSAPASVLTSAVRAA